jgi:hypothetical protein
LYTDKFQFEWAPGFVSIFRNILTLDQEETTSNGITISPSPTSKILNFQNMSEPIDSASLYFFNGKWIKSYNPIDTKINISKAPKGIYLYVLEQDGARTVKRIVRE